MTLIGTRRRARTRWAALGITVALLGLTLSATAFAARTPAPERDSSTLLPSTFEGADGDLTAGTDRIDWTTTTGWNGEDGRDATTAADWPSGSLDNSFGNGTKEDSNTPTVVRGSIPPNKNDLSTFSIAWESPDTTTSTYLYLAWTRVKNNGSANLDFEINQNLPSFTDGSTGSVAIGRRAKDLLIGYDFGGSGRPVIGYQRWLTAATTGDSCAASNTYPCWGQKRDLSTNSAIGGVDPVTGLFGEAAIDLVAAGVLAPNECVNYGSAWVKSRSSSSFTAEVKDFIAPTEIDLSTCQEPEFDPDPAWRLIPTITVTLKDLADDGNPSTIIESRDQELRIGLYRYLGTCSSGNDETLVLYREYDVTAGTIVDYEAVFAVDNSGGTAPWTANGTGDGFSITDGTTGYEYAWKFSYDGDSQNLPAEYLDCGQLVSLP